MESERDILSALETIINAVEELPRGHFNDNDLRRLEGAADALNWVLCRGDELASIFNTNIKAIRLDLEDARRG